MKSTVLYLMFALSFVLFSFKKDRSSVVINEIKVEAPFGMPSIQVPDFRKCKKLPITDFGAVPGDKEKTSQAITKSIDKANKWMVG